MNNNNKDKWLRGCLAVAAAVAGSFGSPAPILADSDPTWSISAKNGAIEGCNSLHMTRGVNGIKPGDKMIAGVELLVPEISQGEPTIPTTENVQRVVVPDDVIFFEIVPDSGVFIGFNNRDIEQAPACLEAAGEDEERIVKRLADKLSTDLRQQATRYICPTEIDEEPVLTKKLPNGYSITVYGCKQNGVSDGFRIVWGTNSDGPKYEAVVIPEQQAIFFGPGNKQTRVAVNVVNGAPSLVTSP